jgi:4-alpha-glucanotransferase
MFQPTINFFKRAQVNYWSYGPASFQSTSTNYWPEIPSQPPDGVRRTLTKDYANGKGVCIAGDIPYNVALESCDLGENPQLFELDPVSGRTRFESGAPADQFVPEGQCWGTPTYAWSAHEQEGFKWWRKRIAASAALYDAIRLDHFRGFESFWAIPAGSKTSKDGYFVKGPGKAFFDAIRRPAGATRVFVED